MKKLRKGECHEPEECAIARTIRGASRRVVGVDPPFVYTEKEIVARMPDRVRSFARAFDEGRYPELIA